MRASREVMDAMADRKLALYFPGRVWTPSLPVRNLVLFFDGIAVLNPPYQRELFDASPLAEELRREGLLEVFTPVDLYDEMVVNGMADFLRQVMAGPDVRMLAVPADPPADLYVVTDVGRAGALGSASDHLWEPLKELQQMNLTRPASEPGKVVMHRDLRVAILTHAAYLIGAKGSRGGTALRPVTDLSFSASDGASGINPADPGHFVSALLAAAADDLAMVGVDEAALISTPLRDLKRYREQNKVAYDAYVASLQEYVQVIFAAPDAISEAAERDRRRAELASASEGVRAVNRSRWNAKLIFMLSALTVAIPPIAGLVVGGPGGAITGGAVGGALTALEATKTALQSRDVPWSGRPTSFSYVVNMPKSVKARAENT
jgi:hypothetical protein